MFDNHWIGSKQVTFTAHYSRFAALTGAFVIAQCVALLGVAVAGQQVLSNSGERFRGRLTSLTNLELEFISSNGTKSIAADQIRQIVIDPTPASLFPRRPLRRFHFPGGEVLSGELIAFDTANALLLLRGKHRLTVPTSVLADVWTPHGEIDVVYEDFEKPLTIWKTERGTAEFVQTKDGGGALRFTKAPMSLSYRLPTPVKSGHVNLRFHDSLNPPGNGRTAVIFQFDQVGSRDPPRMELELSKNEYRFQTLPSLKLAVQPLRRSRGWHRLSVLFDRTKLLVLIDDAVLATGRPTGGQLLEVRIQHTSPDAKAPVQPRGDRATTESDNMLIDDFTIRRFADHRTAKSLTSNQDIVFLASGDELYGDVVGIDSKSIRIDGRFAIAKIGWPKVVGIRRRRSAIAARPVHGLYCRIQFPSPAEWRSQPRDVIFAAIRSVTNEVLLVEHPLLGQLKFNWHEIRRIEPVFDGTCLLIDPGIHHLGDEVRERFRMPLPEGNQLNGEFELASVAGKVAGKKFQFVIEVDNLEPSGPKTPPGTPFLKDLRKGFLITELFINGKKIDVLNRHIVYRTSTDGWQRIRVPVPADILKPGRNSYRLRQQPSRSDPNDFDDCELGRILLRVK